MNIYLDNNATTQPAPEVIRTVSNLLRNHYGNPSSLHKEGKESARILERARAELAQALGCDPIEIIYTSGATEAVHTAFQAACHYSLNTTPQRTKIISTAFEHPCVLEACIRAKEQGFEIIEVQHTPQGELDLEHAAKIINDQVALVNVMWANNETGRIYPIQAFARLAKQAGALFHSDAVQAFGKLNFQLHDFPEVDFASFSAHKIHALKGIGFLYLRRGTPFRPLLSGGPQERGRRAGTENISGIAALSTAAKLIQQESETELTRQAKLMQEFQKELLSLPDTYLNSPDFLDNVSAQNQERLPNTLNISFTGVEAEDLLNMLDHKGVAASAGAACVSGKPEPSHVLRALGFSEPRLRSALRFSLSRYTSKTELEKATTEILSCVKTLREQKASDKVRKLQQ